jgi:hypothetical protein
MKRNRTMSDLDPANDEPEPTAAGDESPAPPLPPPPHILKPRPLLLRLVADHNPVYLLSAACMLASCLALTNSLSWIPIATRRLLTLIVTLNVYEAALLAIALYLVARRRLVHDGRMLLILQAFFLVDFTFLNAEIATADQRLGLWVNATLFALAVLKLGIVMRVLKPSTFTPMQFAFVMIQIFVLFATPCVLWHLDGGRGSVGPRHLYVAWWLTALLPALYEVLTRFDTYAQPTTEYETAGDRAAPTRSYLALPYLSLLTHLGILHYVYNVGFYGAHATPFLLGLTLILNRVSPTGLMPRKDLLTLRLILPLVAVLVSANNPFDFPIHRTYPVIVLTPLNLALLAAFLVYVYCFLRPHAILFLASGAVAAVCYVLGPSRRQIGDAIQTAWDWTSTLAQRIVPKTLADWGILGLIASFALLLIGFWVSLGKRTSETEDPLSPPSS